MTQASRKLAVVTGASAGIGFQLARECAEHGYDLIIAADNAEIETAAESLRAYGTTVEAVQADLSDKPGVDRVVAAIAGRPVGALLANAGCSLGHAFLDQDVTAWRHVIETNVTGTLLLLHSVGNMMRLARSGRILITGSIVAFMPGPYQAVYNASKAFLGSFAVALRTELKGTGVTVTCLMPGATETDVFATADMLDTKIAQIKKDDPATVAKAGFKGMMSGTHDVIPGWHNKLQVAVAHVTPPGILAAIHSVVAKPQH